MGSARFLGGGDISPDATSSVITDTNDANDDWLFNSKNDLTAIDVNVWNAATLYYIRLSTLARTSRPDPNYTAPLINRIEDKLTTPGTWQGPVARPTGSD